MYIAHCTMYRLCFVSIHCRVSLKQRLISYQEFQSFRLVLIMIFEVFGHLDNALRSLRKIRNSQISKISHQQEVYNL